MQYLKKYFTEGLIQMAILLSLCGVRVDVGLDSYLSPSWQEMILGPTSALTQTQFHNLRNRLDSQSAHPKNVDLDGFFTMRRLLGWVHSLDRLQVGANLQSACWRTSRSEELVVTDCCLQVPQAELETWLVQREQDPLPGGFPEQMRAAAAAVVERDPLVQNDEPRTQFGVFNDEEDEGEEAEEVFEVVVDCFTFILNLSRNDEVGNLSSDLKHKSFIKGDQLLSAESCVLNSSGEGSLLK